MSLLQPLAATLFLVLPGLPQQRGGSSAEPDDGTVSMSSLVLDQYVVQHADPTGLALIAKPMISRKIYVREHGPTGAPVESLRQFGSTIVLYDVRDQVTRMREVLERLDQPQAADHTVTAEYRPRFLSHDAALQAAESLVFNASSDGVRILIEGEKSGVEQAMDVLRRLDVPPAQVMLTCWLLEASPGNPTGVYDGPTKVPLPADLSKNLETLLPGQQVSQVGMALLQTTVERTDQIQIQIESTGKRYELSMEPRAFDPETGSLTVRNCNLVEMADAGARLLFSTSALFRGGEYTVLAGTGASLRLLVVRLTPR